MQRILLWLLLVSLLAGAATTAQQPRPDGCDPGNGGLTLPAGFCAAVVADSLGLARHMTQNPRGDLFVVLRRTNLEGGPAVVALRDADGDGRFEQQERFGPGLAGTDIEWHDGFLYVGADTKLARVRIGRDALAPTEPFETIVEFPPQRAHTAKPFAFGRRGEVYIHVGPPSNACQARDRAAGDPGQRPCPLLEMSGGIWKYDAGRGGQKHSSQNRYATGMRHTTSLMAHPVTGALYQVQHGRDQLDTVWPMLFTARQNSDLPAEELQRVHEGANWGWPYCYFDGLQNKRVLMPEYGGDGKMEADCAKYDTPIAAFPAHNAPLDMLFYTATQFPDEYRGGAFVAFHGSWNRAPFPMDGYNVRFIPFKGESPSGPHKVFASGFPGRPQIMNRDDAMYRPAGLLQGQDGSLYISEDVKGRIWKISYRGR